jgi:hypothetical protein
VKIHSLVATVGVTLLATLAAAPVAYSDAADITGEMITSGRFGLSVTPTTRALALPHMAPGDKVTAPITATNVGTLAQRYSVRSVTTGSAILAAQLELTIKTGVTTCTDAGFDTDGTAVYTAGDLGSETGTKVIGDPAVGFQAGDRRLAAATSEVLCFQVLLPASTGNKFQSLTTGSTLTFDAEQIKDHR